MLFTSFMDQFRFGILITSSEQVRRCWENEDGGKYINIEDILKEREARIDFCQNLHNVPLLLRV